ncbi:MAG: nicotinamide riboside transporter PnuC [Eubacteriales bacterium]|nr:nicotinamide riboside transporter PnuC [Eubacteriales bacterium]
MSEKKSIRQRAVDLWHYFTTYEKIWFFSILILAVVFAFLFPEEDVNGVNGALIMALYLADIFLNILCELLISKQSKWNFIVSLFVEITEIVTLIVLASRFATMATTLFFWIPIDIVSFINWHRHPDRQKEELTQVRKLSGWAEVGVIAAIIVWTVGVGYLLTTLDVETDLFGGNETIEIIVCYLDACASAVGMANGLFILFRFREQWIAWYICAALETVINILSGQYVLLILKAGYFTNTTYGYIKWTRYIREHKELSAKKEFF